MLLLEIKRLRDASPNDRRNFGVTVGGVLLVLGLLFYLRHKPAWSWFAWPGLMLLVAGVVSPRSLKWPYVVWMTVGLALGAIISTVLLLILFYAVVTPIAAVARLMGKDFLGRKLDSTVESYWIPRDQSKLRSKSDCERQF